MSDRRWIQFIERTASGTDVPIKPTWSARAVPTCTMGDCPHYDGKRCRVLGFRPDAICEPAVEAMGAELSKSAKPSAQDQDTAGEAGGKGGDQC